MADAAEDLNAQDNTNASDQTQDQSTDTTDTKGQQTDDTKPVEYKLALPKDSLLDPSKVDEIVAYAKEQGLSNEAAQEILNNHSESVTAYKDSQDNEAKGIVASWLSDAENDKEIGGAEFKKNGELAKRVVDRFATPEFKSIMNDKTYPFGNHPEVIRIFSRIGKLMGEDMLTTGNAAGEGEKDMAEVFYPSKKED